MVATRGEEDSAVLVVVDALAETASPAASTAGERWTSPCVPRPRSPSTTSAAVTGSGCGSWGWRGDLSCAAGRRHLRRLQGTLARVRRGEPHDLSADRLRFGAGPGTVVIVLSPMLHDVVVTATAVLAGRGSQLRYSVAVISDHADSAGGARSSGVGREACVLAEDLGAAR